MINGGRGIYMKTKILFVCTANHDRSPTAEIMYQRYSGLEAKSTGIFKPEKKVREGLAWADVIVVMEDIHETYIREHFAQELEDKPVFVLGIEDRYRFMEDDLTDLIEERMEAVLQSIF